MKFLFSINAFLEEILSPKSKGKAFRWNCLFPVDNGAFFVIYALQAAIVGNTVELLRIPELSLYILYSLMLKSPVEFEKARKMITFEFPFGVSYARFLLIFTITITYSQACPLIAPCGLFSHAWVCNFTSVTHPRAFLFSQVCCTWFASTLSTGTISTMCTLPVKSTDEFTRRPFFLCT